MIGGADPRHDALVRLGGRLRQLDYAFVTATPASHARVNARPGNDEARDLAGVFGWTRPFGAGIVPDDIVALMRQAGILLGSHDGSRDGRWRSAVRVSSLAGELFFHSAYPTTEPDAVFFGPDTYRFAGVIATALQARSRPIRRAADVGCGAGPGGIVVAKACPEAEVVMLDINEAALSLARVNADLARTPNAAALRSDLLTGTDGLFDLVVSNPPYLNDPLERAYRHGGGRHGEDLSLRILEAGAERLAPGGTLVLYTGSAMVEGRDVFRDRALRKLDGAAFVTDYREIDPDVFGEELDTPPYADADRIAAVALTVTRNR